MTCVDNHQVVDFSKDCAMGADGMVEADGMVGADSMVESLVRMTLVPADVRCTMCVRPHACRASTAVCG